VSSDSSRRDLRDREHVEAHARHFRVSQPPRVSTSLLSEGAFRHRVTDEIGRMGRVGKSRVKRHVDR
jgi:hypothetical protein